MEAAEEPGAGGGSEAPESEPEAPGAGSGEPEGPAEPPEPAEPEGTAPAAGESGADQADPCGTLGPAAPGDAEEAERRERAALLAEFRALEDERQRLRQADARLQLLLGRALQPARGERREDEEGGLRPFEERLRELRELRRRREREAAVWERRVDARRRDRADCEAGAAAAWAAFQARKRAVALRTLARRRGGREAALAAVADIQAREEAKESSVREARLENVRAKLEVRNLESALRARGETLRGRRVAELNRMKRENQELREKLDGLDGEVLKLRQKVADAERGLGRVREKLRLVEAENRGREAELRDVASAVRRRRDALTAATRARDGLRARVVELRRQRGLLGQEPLLRGFEQQADAVELLRQKLEALQRRHAGVMLQLREIRKGMGGADPLLP